MIIDQREYLNKVLGCWMGKNIGGTLGAPFEWKRQVNDVTYYTQELGGEPLPNDDLDIQLLWLVALEEKGVEIDAKTLADYWLLYVTPHWAEYGTAKINMRAGLLPPLSGTHNNVYKDSCGCFIRSEIWACIAPGCPRIAVKYAFEDAILDHGDGEGVYAEVFCAALESVAFVEKDLDRLIEIGLSYIPADCGVAGAIHCAIESFRAGKTWLEARHTMLERYRGSNLHNISDEDRARGFAEGQQGWDAPSNIGMIIIGLLYGQGDFDESIRIAVNCGEDTDCTAATLGSIFGIMHGIDAFTPRWTQPIGRKIKTACLNLGELGYFGNQLPADIDDLARRTEQMARQVIMCYNLPVELAPEKATDLSDLKEAFLTADSTALALYENMSGPVFRFDFFDVAVDYAGSPLVRENEPKKIKLRIRNKYKVQENINIRWYAPEGWTVNPGEGTVFVTPAWFGKTSAEVEFTLAAEKIGQPLHRFVVELTLNGRPTAMLVPVTLLNGSLSAC